MRHPRPEAKMGPIVDPQAMSDLTQNSCVGMPRLYASSLRTHPYPQLTCCHCKGCLGDCSEHPLA